MLDQTGKPCKGYALKCTLLALPTNISQGFKAFLGTNALAYLATREKKFCEIDTCENEYIIHPPDLDEVIGDEGGDDDDDAVSRDRNQPLQLLQKFGAKRFRVAALAPMKIFQFLEKNIFVCINVCMYACICLFLSVCLSVHLSVYQFIPPSICVTIHISLCPSITPSLSTSIGSSNRAPLSVCLFL